MSELMFTYDKRQILIMYNHMGLSAVFDTNESNEISRKHVKLYFSFMGNYPLKKEDLIYDLRGGVQSKNFYVIMDRSFEEIKEYMDKMVFVNIPMDSTIYFPYSYRSMFRANNVCIVYHFSDFDTCETLQHVEREDFLRICDAHFEHIYLKDIETKPLFPHLNTLIIHTAYIEGNTKIELPAHLTHLEIGQVLERQTQVKTFFRAELSHSHVLEHINTKNVKYTNLSLANVPMACIRDDYCDHPYTQVAFTMSSMMHGRLTYDFVWSEDCLRDIRIQCCSICTEYETYIHELISSRISGKQETNITLSLIYDHYCSNALALDPSVFRMIRNLTYCNPFHEIKDIFTLDDTEILEVSVISIRAVKIVHQTGRVYKFTTREPMKDVTVFCKKSGCGLVIRRLKSEQISNRSKYLLDVGEALSFLNQ